MIKRIGAYSAQIALAGLALLVLALALYLIRGELAWQSELPLALGGLLLLVAVFANPDQIRQALTGRQARYGGNAILLSITFVAILGLVNFLAARHHKRFDLTAERQYSLSPQTIQVLKTLDRPVKISVFALGGFHQQLEDIFAEYAYHSDQITYEFIDPDRRPSIAREYAISSYNTIVYESEGQRHDSFGIQEQDITTAILKVTDARAKVVYFLTGHGERGIDDFGEQGLNRLKQALERDAFQVKPLNLAITDTVPADATVLVIARPTQPLLEHEHRAILRYLLDAGKALIAQDPGLPEVFDNILTAYRMRFRGDVIIDPASSLMGDPGAIVVQNYPFSLITQGLPMTIFPQAQSIEILDDTNMPAFTIRPLLESSDRSWGETNFTDPRVRFDQGEDYPGPLAMGVTVDSQAPLTPERAETKTSTKTRLVVVGDSDFMSNSFIGSTGNLDLTLNAINWLAEQEELVSIRPKDVQQRQLILTAGQARLVMYSSMIFLPLVVLAFGVAIWWNRR